MNKDERGLGVGVKTELKIGMVIDNYKIPKLEWWWEQALKKLPNVEKLYVLDRQESHPFTKDTTSYFRYYRIKDQT